MSPDLIAMVSKAPPGKVLTNILNEVTNVMPKVSIESTVPTSGCAICYYDVKTGLPKTYEVKYQEGNVGNVVHELIHVCVNEAYKQDFVNYPNRTPKSPPPDRKYDSQGRCTNEFDRQTAFMNQTKNEEVATKLSELTRWANASLELELNRRTAIVDKFNYGLQWPMKEYDTVITQVLVWLHEWEYPLTNLKPDQKKPVVNALFEEVEKAVGRAFELRQGK